MSTETDIVERLARIIDPEAMAEYEAGFGRGGPTYDQLAVYPRVKAARLKASGLLPAVRAERDAAARDMRERCIAAARAHGAWAEKMIEENGVDPVHFGTIANAADDIGALISALPATVIATEGNGRD